MAGLLGSATGIVDIDVDPALGGLRSLDAAFDSVLAGGDPFAQIDASADRFGATITATANEASAAMGRIDGASDQAAAALNGVNASASTATTGMRAVDGAADQAAAGMQAVDGSADAANASLASLGTSASASATATNAAGKAAQQASQSIIQVDNATDRASRGLNKGSTDAQRFGAAVIALERDITTAGFALAGFGAGVGAVIALAVAEFVRFEAAMRNVNSIAGLTDDALAQLSDQVLELSSQVGQGPTELAEGLYDIQSSGFEAAEGLEILEKAAIAATAGLTGTATSARAITAVLNAYGKSASEAGDVSDLLFSIVDKGVVTFENLANNLGTVLPVAAALRVPFEQVAAAYAQLTLNGISAAQSETALAAAMRSAINPTEQLTAAVQQAGFESAEMAVQAVGLSGYLQILMQASGGSSEALSQLLGTAEATTAVLALMNDGGAGLTAMMGEMSAAMTDGAYAQGVFNEQAKSTAFQMQQLGVAASNMRIALGEALSPLINTGVSGLTTVIEAITAGFRKLPGPVQSAVAGVLAFTGATAGIIGAAALAIPRIRDFAESVRDLNEKLQLGAKGMSVLRFAISPVGLALTAIGAVAIAGIAIWQRHRNKVEEAKKAYEELQASMKATEDAIRAVRLQGDFRIAEMMEAEVAEMRTIIADWESAMQDVDWFGNEVSWGEASDRLMDFIKKDVGKEVLRFIDESEVEWRTQWGKSLADIFGETPEAVSQAIQAGTFHELIADATLDELVLAAEIIKPAAAEYWKQFAPTNADKKAAEEAMKPLLDLFTNPNIDQGQLIAAMDAIWQEFRTGGHDIQWLSEQMSSLYQDITMGADSWNILKDSMSGVTNEARQLGEVLKDTTEQQQNLRLDGMDEAASQINIVTQTMESLRTSWTVTHEVLDETSGRFVTVTETISLTDEQMQAMGVTIDRFNQMLASGMYNNNYLMDEFRRITSDTTMTAAEMDAALVDLIVRVNSLSFGLGESVVATALAADELVYLEKSVRGLGTAITETAGDIALANSEAFAFSQTIKGLGEGVTTTASEAAQGHAEALQDLNDATIEWLGNGDNILAFLNSYISESNTAAQSSIEMAMALNQSANAMDSMLAVFGEIDALAQRSANANSIADNLIGAPGELGALQDLWTRIIDKTSVATLTQQEYDDALAAGLSIQESNSRVQDYITQIQAQQLPLLAEQQLAYEENLRVLSEMNAEEQQRALYLQSSAGQAAVASAYSTAYAASLGEIPEEVATELIANAAASDPILKQTLLDLGLINETDGVITVNFPDGPTVQETIIELTRSIDALIVAMGGVPPLHVDAGEADDAKKKIEDLTRALSDPLALSVEDNASPMINAILRGLRAADGTDAEPGVSLDDNATEPTNALGRALAALGATEEDAIVNLSGNAIDDTTYLQEVLDNLNGGTTTHTIEIKQIGGSFMDAAGRAAEGAQQPAAPEPDRGQASDFGMQGPPPIVMPAIDTTLFDQSLAALPGKIDAVAPALGLAATNAGAVAGAGVANGLTFTGVQITTAITGWTLAINTEATLMALAGTNAGAVAGAATANGIVMQQPVIQANIAQWTATINTEAPTMATAGVNAGSVAGYGAANGIASAEGQISSNVGVWPGIIDGVAGAMGSAGFNAGAAAGYGAANGLNSALGAVQAAASAIANTVAAAMATALLIASPSKVTTRLGQYAGEGLARGLLDRETMVYEAAATVARATLDGYNETMAKGRWYDPRAGGNQGGSPREPEPGNGGKPDPMPPAPTTPEETIQRELTGILNPLSDAIKALGLGIDITAKSMFSESAWQQRVKDLGLTKALEIGDLFANRWANQSFANGAFIPGKWSRYTEHYGSPLIPDIADIPDPTKPPTDPTTPGRGVTVEYGRVMPNRQAPNRPNTGSGRAGYGSPTIVERTIVYDQRSTTTNQLAEPDLIRVVHGARDGSTARATIAQTKAARASYGGRTQRSLSRS